MAHSETIPAGNSNEPGWQGIVGDWSADKQTFQVPWGKAMMWIFLLSDTFIFSCFLTGYMNVRISTPVAWPNPSEVFAGAGLDPDVTSDGTAMVIGANNGLSIATRSCP